MRIRDEPRVDILRKKAEVLESENERLSRRVASLQRENLALKGMSPEAIALNLPQLLDRTTSKAPSSLTRPGSEGRQRENKGTSKDKRTGHGPTPQPELEIVEETIDLDEADKVCTECGGDLDAFIDDVVETIDVVERIWVVKKSTLKKYRCKCGGCVQTAEGPAKLVKGGRYSLDVAINIATAKYIDHLPLARQVRMAKRRGLRITTQAMWDQLQALSDVTGPTCERIRQHLLRQQIIGVDETGFKLIEKGGAAKRQVWQLSCPEAIYFEILASKHAAVGEELFLLKDAKGNEMLRFAGTCVMDGAAELDLIATRLGFTPAGCWSHARRNVLKAEKEAPGQVAQFLDLVADLYDIDKRALREREEDDVRLGYRHLFDQEKLRVLRSVESRAICDRMQRWMLEQSCIPGGLLKKGLDYVAARWTKLLRFLDDPLIPLDNNLVESRFIGLAIGRRNYIGARSPRGTLAAGRFYTIVESAHVNGKCGEKVRVRATTS